MRSIERSFFCLDAFLVVAADGHACASCRAEAAEGLHTLSAHPDGDQREEPGHGNTVQQAGGGGARQDHLPDLQEDGRSSDR
eukprot:5403538-Pyramimonas_sp.AAC.1